MSVTRDQRFTPQHPCPVCTGHDRDPRGAGRRCFGFISSDRRWAHCTRDEHAGALTLNSATGAYPHHLLGACSCGIEHGGAIAPPATREPAQGPRHQQPRTSSDPAAAGHVVERYIYRDASGAPVLRVTRKADPKSFYQERPDGGGGWQPGTEGVDLVPYRLPEMLAADPDQWVFIVEGERDCDRLHHTGMLATCNPMGAKKWRDSYSVHLAGRRCCIIADNDQVGREHAEQVAKSLYAGGATSVRVLNLPRLPEHGDVSDFLDNGGTVDQLELLAEVVPPWQPPAKPSGPSCGGDCVPVAEHRAKVAELEHEIAELRDLASYHAELQSLTWSAVRNSSFASIGHIMAGIGVCMEWRSAIERGRDEAGDVRITLSDVEHIDRATGEVVTVQGKARALGYHHKRLGGILRRVSRESGAFDYSVKPVGGVKTAAFISVPDYDPSAPDRHHEARRAMLAAVRRLATAEQPETAQQPRRGSGSRPPACPRHPHAELIARVRREWWCPHCAAVVAEDEPSGRRIIITAIEETHERAVPLVTPGSQDVTLTAPSSFSVTSCDPGATAGADDEWEREPVPVAFDLAFDGAGLDPGEPPEPDDIDADFFDSHALSGGGGMPDRR